MARAADFIPLISEIVPLDRPGVSVSNQRAVKLRTSMDDLVAMVDSKALSTEYERVLVWKVGKQPGYYELWMQDAGGYESRVGILKLSPSDLNG
jgi:hypothetical protein